MSECQATASIVPGVTGIKFIWEYRILSGKTGTLLSMGALKNVLLKSLMVRPLLVVPSGKTTTLMPLSRRSLIASNTLTAAVLDSLFTKTVPASYTTLPRKTHEATSLFETKTEGIKVPITSISR